MAAAMANSTGAAARGRVPRSAERVPGPKGQSGDRRKGPRAKHVPQRMCIACRQHDAKRGLIRIVRTPEGTVEIDPSGRRNGRGAYLCHQTACWEKALAAGLLRRALNTEVNAETVDTLRRHAATLQPAEQPAAPIQAANEGGIA